MTAKFPYQIASPEKRLPGVEIMCWLSDNAGDRFEDWDCGYLGSMRNESPIIYFKEEQTVLMFILRWGK